MSGRQVVQRLLQKNIQASQYLMGIGSGAGVFSSGEQVIIDVLQEIRPEPYCILDVGSNKGQFVELCLTHIGTDKFEIHCFEPGKETFNILVQNTKGDARIRLNNIGIGKECGSKTLYSDKPGSGLASLTKRKLDHFGITMDRSEQIDLNTIDNYCSECRIQNIDLLKLDIEGHELDALSGATRMFDRDLVSIVTFEFGGCNIDTRSFFQDFWYFFSQFKMKIYRITPSRYLHAIESYGEMDEQFRTTNFVAIKTSNETRMKIQGAIPDRQTSRLAECVDNSETCASAKW